MSPAQLPRILVVEDDEPIRALLLAAMRRRAPVIIDTARDGLEATELLDINHYTVVLIDLMMPRMNGFELLEHIAAKPPANRPVIFIMTAFDTRGREFEPGLVHGVIRKPFDIDVVVEMVTDCALLHAAAAAQPAVPETQPRIEPVC